MNYDVSKELLSVSNLVYEGCQELPIDLDFSLPDYCPDIQKILKCSVKANISSRNISGDRLNIDGVAMINLIYLEADKLSIRCCENSSPFSCSIDLKNSPENAVAVTNTRIEYMNCRAVSPRKIDIHGAFSICAKVYNKDNLDITSSIESEDIQQRKENITCSNLIGIGQQQFSVNEILDLGQGKPEPELIVRSDASLVFDDYKTLDGKVVIKGNAIIKILYTGDVDSSNLEAMEYSIPISQIVDVPGVVDGCTCTVNMELLNHEERIYSENGESNNVFSTDMRIAATVLAYTDKEIDVLIDAYSTKYDLECSSENIELCNLNDIINDKFNFKTDIKVSGFNISRIIDVWSDVITAKSKVNDGKIIFNGKMNICIIATDPEGVPFYIERIAEFTYDKDFSNDTNCINANVKVVPLSIGYRITGNDSVEVNVDLAIHADLYICIKQNMVIEANADESKPTEKDTKAALTIYFANAGEDVWDIARRYYTSVEAVKSENDITEDKLDKERMLLIPM